MRLPMAKVTVVVLAAGSEALKCLDNHGNEVDWWFMYKVPNGYKFAYNDPDSGDSTTPLIMYERDMNDESNPVAITRTLMALAEENTTRRAAYAPGSAGYAASLAVEAAAGGASPSYYLYNDQPDVGSASSSYGHTKGVVAAGPDHASGLWIVHSTPHWPASTGRAKFYFPPEEIIYGQTFLCVSLDQGELDAVGEQQRLMRPFVYHRTNLFADDPEAVAAYYPALAAVLSGEWLTAPGTRAHVFNAGSSLQTFTSLAKNKEWADDLWENLVAKHYDNGFLVESWMRGQELGPYCPPAQPYVVVDAKTLYVSEKGVNVTWTETQDHAKWGVALDSSYVVCVGDINRMTSQRKRGGGAVCFSNRKLCYGMYRTILSSDVCDGALGGAHANATANGTSKALRPL